MSELRGISRRMFLEIAAAAPLQRVFYASNSAPVVPAQEQDNLRMQYFNRFVTDYFNSKGIDITKDTSDSSKSEKISEATVALGQGIEFTVNGHNFNARASLGSAAMLDLTSDGIYLIDAGINGVDKFGIEGYILGREIHSALRRPIPLMSGSIKSAVNDFQIASLRVLSANYSQDNLKGSLKSYEAAKIILKKIVGINST